MLRQWIYRDHYHPGLKASEVERWMSHAGNITATWNRAYMFADENHRSDHCLELVRQAIMCHADTTLMTFRWDEAHPQPMLKLQGPPHMCWDWEELISEMKPRVIPPEEMRRLANPISVD